MTNPHLEGLIRKWREEADRRRQVAKDHAAVEAAGDEAWNNGLAESADQCADELEAALAALPGGGVDAKREAWAIVRPDGVTIHPESVRGSEHAAQWAIGNWKQMERDGFTCRRVNIATLPTPNPHEADRNG